jgi:hypothetical protein
VNIENSEILPEPVAPPNPSLEGPTSEIEASSTKNKSTGPKRGVGKRISSRNALKHGAFSQEFICEHLLDAKDRKKYRQVLQGFLDVYEPLGQAELFQVELMAYKAHKLKCVLRLSRALSGDATRDISQDLFISGSDSGLVERWRLDIPPLEILEKLNRAEAHCLHQYNRAAAELERLQRMRLGDEMPPRITLDVNS